MAFKFKVRKPRINISLPSIPRIGNPEPEQLMGQVGGFEASAPEERLARALDKANINYTFRYTFGAPRGLPGWKELDFLVSTGGLLYAIEVDTAFTHRAKANADVLHDALILNDKEIKAIGILYPKVFHADGDTDLASEDGAKSYVAHLFGK